MTPEELEQLRTVTGEEINRVVEERQLVTRGDLNRAMVAIADEFAEARKELKALDRRTERMEINLNSVLM